MISYLQVENLTKSFGDLVLFKNISFGIAKDQKTALIAKNGAGKTTLMNIISGLDTPDSGQVTFRNNVSVGYLAQNPEIDDEKTVMEQVYASSNSLIVLVREYETALVNGDQKTIEALIPRMDELKAWDFEVKAKQILSQLKILNFNQKIKELSGGQKKRVALANVLINEPDFLILDEPTNHLDLEMIEWFEAYLEKSKSTLLMVTHDRYFLDRVCNEIIELDENKIYQHNGNYSYYLEKREERILIQGSEVDKAKNLMRKELDWIRRMPKARGTKAKYRVDAFYDLQDKASQKRDDKQVKLNVQASRLGSKILEIKNLSKSFDNIKIIDQFTYTFSRFEKIGIVGKNGSGKSTFLNLITGQMPYDSGVIETGETVVFGYYRQQGIDFDDKMKVIDAAKNIAEVVTMGDGKTMTASQFLNYFLFPPDTQYNYISKLSGGERRRLYLMTVLMKNPNFLVLDEPTNDLDIMTLNILEDYLQSFNGCLIVVSHDRYFMDKLVDHLFVFEGDGKVKDFPGNYSDYRDWAEEKEKSEKKEQKEIKPERVIEKVEKPKKLSFKEKQELEQLEDDLQTLGNEKTEVESKLSSGSLSSDELIAKSNRIAEILALLDEKEMRWLELNEIG